MGTFSFSSIIVGVWDLRVERNHTLNLRGKKDRPNQNTVSCITHNIHLLSATDNISMVIYFPLNSTMLPYGYSSFHSVSEQIKLYIILASLLISCRVVTQNGPGMIFPLTHMSRSDPAVYFQAHVWVHMIIQQSIRINLISVTNWHIVSYISSGDHTLSRVV